jgi:hypothetical protein
MGQVAQPVEPGGNARRLVEQDGVVAGGVELGRQPALAAGIVVRGDRRVEAYLHVLREQAAIDLLVVDDQHPDRHAEILHTEAAHLTVTRFASQGEE